MLATNPYIIKAFDLYPFFHGCTHRVDVLFYKLLSHSVLRICDAILCYIDWQVERCSKFDGTIETLWINVPVELCVDRVGY